MKLVPTIDNETCTLCGKCIAICPKEVLEVSDEKVITNVDECMLCSHCYGVCPVDAISFDEEALREPAFGSFKYKESMVPLGKGDATEMINLLRSRRSVRRYTEEDVPNEMIRDLIACGITAPSGSNRQEWAFTVVNGREKVWNLAGEIGKFFVKLNKLAANPLVRFISVPFMGKKLINYYENNFESTQRALTEAEAGRDMLFHGAPALILIHSPMGKSTPIEDGQYSSYNMTLGAHAMGLGTCYIGYATEAVNRVSAIKEYLKIPEENRVHAVLTVGYPGNAIAFRRASLRKPWKETWI